MSRTLTVFAAQVRSVAFDPAATLEKFEEEVWTATRDFPEVNVLLFPELYLTGDDPFARVDAAELVEKTAEAIPGPITDRVGKIAARAERWIVAGSILERSEDGLHNTAIVFSPQGELVARHRKVFPWRPWEQAVPGDGPTVFEVPGVGTVGLMICYELWFPETARGLALSGAEVILQPSLTTTPDRAEELVLARAAAIVNQCFVVSLNGAASIGGGRSIGVDPEGRVLFEAGPGEEFIVEVLDLDRVSNVRERGTRGLNRVWKHFVESPPGVFEPYRRFLEGR
ncbi:MAG: carbon-nitrogen hydrolase family protein [Actinomycetota bacterium]